jgi:hypothetical protein
MLGNATFSLIARFDGIGLEARGGIWLVLEDLVEDPHDDISIDAFQ